MPDSSQDHSATWPLEVELPLTRGVNAAERSRPIMVGPMGRQRPKLDARGAPVLVRVKSEEAKAWRAAAVPAIACAMRAAQWWPAHTRATVDVEIDVYVRTILQDADSVIKSTLDAFEAATRDLPIPTRAPVSWKTQPLPRWSDRYVAQQRSRKLVCPEHPRIVLRARDGSWQFHEPKVSPRAAAARLSTDDGTPGRRRPATSPTLAAAASPRGTGDD